MAVLLLLRVSQGWEPNEPSPHIRQCAPQVWDFVVRSGTLSDPPHPFYSVYCMIHPRHSLLMNLFVGLQHGTMNWACAGSWLALLSSVTQTCQLLHLHSTILDPTLTATSNAADK